MQEFLVDIGVIYLSLNTFMFFGTSCSILLLILELDLEVSTSVTLETLRLVLRASHLKLPFLYHGKRRLLLASLFNDEARIYHTRSQSFAIILFLF